jgi:hypothetical protein
MHELSKAGKRHARALISKGVEQEFAIGLKEFDAILQQWKDGKQNNRESYHAVYESVTSYNKYIARRYDNVTNSTLLFIVLAIYNDNLITDEDLKGFSEETMNHIKRNIKLLELE